MNSPFSFRLADGFSPSKKRMNPPPITAATRRNRMVNKIRRGADDFFLYLKAMAGQLL
jgi:hypothetical protein